MLRNSIFQLYSFFSGNSLNQFYKTIKLKNDGMLPYSENDITVYLNKWNFHAKLEDNPLMEKKDIIDWCNKLEAYPKAHTFSFTGGSMGNPLKIPLSKKRFLFKAASIKYYFDLTGYRIGDPYMMVKAKPRNRFLSIIRNETIFLPRDISSDNLAHISNVIEKKRIKYCVGYTSFFHELALFLVNAGRKLSGVKCIVCASEALHPHQFADISRAFDCMILSRYSNEEVGIIAHQRETNGAYLVDRAGVVVEVLNPDTLQACKPGEEGNVIITDLHADLFSLIRYNTGDRAVVGEYRDGQLYSLQKIIGREAEKLYNTSGNPISSLSIGPGIYKPLSQNQRTVTFQFAQLQKSLYELRFKGVSNQISDSETQEIKENLFEILGRDAVVDIVYVDDLKKRKSGKTPVYINEWIKE